MTKCLNNGSGFPKLGYTPTERKRIFYGICIWVRVILGLIVWYNSFNATFHKIVPYVTLLGGMVGIYSNFKGLGDKCIWWSRKFHLLSSCLVFIISVLSLFNKIDIKYVACVIWTDVLLGFLYSVLVQPWN
jgi:hypothetical protein